MNKLLAVVLLLLSTNTLNADTTGLTSAFSPIKAFDYSKLNANEQSKIQLGKKLYIDNNLSENRKISCNSCHKLDGFGVDNLATSPGHVGQLGDRNSPTTFNSSLHAKQFWDGRANDLVEQAVGPMTNPKEMAMASADQVLERIKENKEYELLFKQAFPNEKDPLTIQNAAVAIAEFEKTLLTPSRFDKYLEGDEKALNDQEKLGLKMFVETGCVACHAGAGIGGQMFQKLGLVKPYQTEDLGRFKVTNIESDKYVFKVPSLRNIEKTGPYFHDGKVKTLAEAVKIMASHQLGKELKEQDVESIIAFLRSLTGEVKVP